MEKAETSTDRRFKNDIYEQFARIGKAVSSPKRLELLDLICQGPKTVEMFAKEFNMTVGNTSRHLQILGGSSLIESQNEGLYVTYRLTGQAACEFFQSMQSLAKKRLADIDHITRQCLNDCKGLEAVNIDELIERVRQKSVMVLDVRPLEEFKSGHIPGAISMPLKELEAHIAELPKDKEIIAYCRGPYCVLADQAVETLIKKGYRALRMEDGVPDWRARGFRVAVGEK